MADRRQWLCAGVRAINPDNPDGAVRTLAFGNGGMITILVLDGLARVDVLTVSWAR